MESGNDHKIRKMKGHREYDHKTYIACGYRYTAEGWTPVQALFYFRGPEVWETTDTGLVRLAQALARRWGLPMHGDEDVTHVVGMTTKEALRG